MVDMEVVESKLTFLREYNFRAGPLGTAMVPSSSRKCFKPTNQVSPIAIPYRLFFPYVVEKHDFHRRPKNFLIQMPAPMF